MLFQFTNCCVDTDCYRLLRSNTAVSLEPQVFDLLVYLIENRERVVTREELLENLWKGKVVTDSALGASVKEARKAIGDNGSEQSVIKTVHGRGYQFVATVSAADDNPSKPIVSSATYPELPAKPSIAVLPFTNVSPDPDQEFFAIGLTEDISNSLSRLQSLFVVSSYSTAVYRERDINICDVGFEQGVRYVLTGSVRKSGNRLRITAKLIDTDSGEQRWSERYDRELEDIFAIQDEITHNVTLAMQVEVNHGEQARLWARGTQSVQAWELATRAIELYSQDIRENNIEARKINEQAASIDPGYVLAWVGLGWTHWLDAMYGWTDSLEESTECARELADKAHSLNPDSAAAWTLTAGVHQHSKDIAASVSAAKHAANLEPNNPGTIAIYADILIYAGQLNEVIPTAKHAIRLCPNAPPWYYTTLAKGYEQTNKFELSIETYRRAIVVDQAPLSRTLLAHLLIKLGKLEEAKVLVDEIQEMDPTFFNRRKVWHLEAASKAIIESGILGGVEK